MGKLCLYVRYATCFEADANDDASYDFDLLFTRRRGSAGAGTALSWVVAPAQTGFAACLWLRTSTTSTPTSIISLSASRTTMTSPDDELRTQDDHCDVTVTTDSRQVHQDLQSSSLVGPILCESSDTW